MRYLLQKSRLQHLIQHRNGYLMLACGSMVLNVSLVMLLFFMLGRERIIIVPPEIQKSFWLTSNKVSPDYLSQMTIFFNSLNFNMTPSNASQQHAVLLRYVDPAYYESVKIKLLEIEDRIKKENISISFQPTQYPKIDANKLIAEVSGDLQYSIGDIQLAPQHVVFRWGFHYVQGQLFISSFPEVKKNV